MIKIPFLEEIEKRSPERLVRYGKILRYHTNQLKEVCVNTVKEAFDCEPSEEEKLMFAMSRPETLYFALKDGYDKITKRN